MSPHHDDEILDLSPNSTASVSHESSPASDEQGSHSEADPDIPICQRCDCKKCKKLQKRANRKRGKRASLKAVANLFPRPE